jgi:hypothetical protein
MKPAVKGPVNAIGSEQANTTRKFWGFKKTASGSFPENKTKILIIKGRQKIIMLKK